jgi:hypothetical protein
MRKTFALFAAVALASAASAATLPWKRAATPDQSLSVETPCSDAEIENYRSAPEDLLGEIDLKQESRVLCLQDNLLLLAGALEIGTVPGSKSAFDGLLAEMAKDPSVKNKPSVVTIGGRRAILNRVSKDGLSAQTVFVDLDATKVALILVGYQPGSTAGPTEQAATIDRFTQSLQVTSK